MRSSRFHSAIGQKAHAATFASLHSESFLSSMATASDNDSAGAYDPSSGTAGSSASPSGSSDGDSDDSDGFSPFQTRQQDGRSERQPLAASRLNSHPVEIPEPSGHQEQPMDSPDDMPAAQVAHLGNNNARVAATLTSYMKRRKAHHERMHSERNGFTIQSLHAEGLPEVAFDRLCGRNSDPPPCSRESCSNPAVLRCLGCDFGARPLLCTEHDQEAHPFAHFHQRQRFYNGYWENLAQETILDEAGQIVDAVHSDDNTPVGGTSSA